MNAEGESRPNPLPPAELDPGVAGASAAREHERRKASREERVKGRLGRRLGGALLAVTDEPHTTRAWARGAEGEREFAKALEVVPGIRVLHDRGVPGSRANIDHIVVSPSGVFVVDAKLYKGAIRVGDARSFFRREKRLFVGRRDCSNLADGVIWQASVVTGVLEAAAIQPLPPISAVLCFVRGEWPLFRPPSLFRDVRLEGTRSIKKLLLASQVLDSTAIDRIAAALAIGLRSK